MKTYYRLTEHPTESVHLDVTSDGDGGDDDAEAEDDDAEAVAEAVEEVCGTVRI